MIDHDTAVRVLQDIWRWKPVVEPKIRSQKEDTVFQWPWSNGRRAMQRIAYLSIHTQLLGDLRRRVRVEGTDDELSQYLLGLKLQACRCVPEEVTGEIIIVKLSSSGMLVRMPIPKSYKAPKSRTEKEAIEEADALDEEEPC